MGDALADRKQRKTQPEDKERKSCHYQQRPDEQRNQAFDRLPDDEKLEDTDDDDDRQQIAQAIDCVVKESFE